MSYPGSKAGNGVWQRIIGQMPPHSVYVEPFLGSGHVFKMKREAERSIVCDADMDLLPDWGHCQTVQDWAGGTGGKPLIALHGDAIFALWKFEEQENAVIYCDPPYLLSTRKGRRYYKHEMTDEQHADFLRIVCGLKCNVLISHPPCDLYGSSLQNWRCIRYKTRWHTKTAIDALWCNFPEPAELHDWRFAGNNHRQRTALKRLLARYVGRLNRMAPRKRGYVLNGLREYLSVKV